MLETETELIKVCYLPELETLYKIYYDEYEKFHAKSLEKIQKLEKEYALLLGIKEDEELRCVLDEKSSLQLDNIERIDYFYLASKIQSLVSTWENELIDFFLLDKLPSYERAKEKFKEHDLYDMEANEDINLIRHIANFLKHSEFGRAKKYLKNTKYICNSQEFGAIRGNFLCSDTLNISIEDITFIYETFRDFWIEVEKNARSKHRWQ